jgi:serine protease Do
MRRVLIGLLVLGSVSISGAMLPGAEVDKKLPADHQGKTWLKRWVHSPYENERSHSSVKGAFREVVQPASQATVRVLSDGLQCSLGMVIHSDGFILTKASELDGKLECVLRDGRRLEATRFAQRDELDLALLKIDAAKLPVVTWSDTPIPQIGSWLATPNIDGEAASIGVVSVEPRAIPNSQPVLGVNLGQAQLGVRVNRVSPGSGAARAGLRENDVIETLNGRAIDSPDTLTGLIMRLQPGDRVTLAVRRESELLPMMATLGDKSRLGDQEQAELMDSLGGPLSRRRGGFSSVLQHDSVLRPRDCGGPVVDLDGKAVGVNIARASRVATYALPATVVRPVAMEMLKQGLAQKAGDVQHPVSTNR